MTPEPGSLDEAGRLVELAVQRTKGALAELDQVLAVAARRASAITDAPELAAEVAALRQLLAEQMLETGMLRVEVERLRRDLEAHERAAAPPQFRDRPPSL